MVEAPLSAHEIWPERHITALWGVLCVLIVGGFVGWAWGLRTVAAGPSPGTVNVIEATFGKNCGAPNNNVLQWVRSACMQRSVCNFQFDYSFLGNPAPSCIKEFHVTWNCRTDGLEFHHDASAEPTQGSVISLACR